MTPGVLTAVLVAGSVTLALAGPWLLRRAAPALVRVPRVAIAVLAGGIIVWLGALLAIGPVLAWADSGPTLLPQGAAAVCQRCLAAANPFPVGYIDTGIPAVLLLALPMTLALTLAAGVTDQMVRRARRSREAAHQLLHGAERRRLRGYDVAVVDTERPFALTFSARHGGIVLSTGAMNTLDDGELAATLAHENAHLRQHHHAVSSLVASITVFLRWVPLVAAAADALPHYLEIAADNAARRDAGTPALVSALLKLGERTPSTAPRLSGAEALHAAGPERIRQLVSPDSGRAGAVPAMLIGACLVTLALVSAAVTLPYASAALTGCA